jgi:hypothetical protein
MTSFCSCTKSNNKVNDNVLDVSIHNVSLVKDDDVNIPKNDICNILSIFNIFCSEWNNNESIKEDNTVENIKLDKI